MQTIAPPQVCQDNRENAIAPHIDNSSNQPQPDTLMRVEFGENYDRRRYPRRPTEIN
jgi:hypothetical protein